MTAKHYLQKWGGPVLVLGLFALPWLISSSGLRLIELILIYSIAAMGLQLLTGQTGLISLGQAGFMAIGAYVSAYLIGLQVPLWLVLILAVGIAGLVGLLLGLPSSRLQGPYLAIATLAFGMGVSTWIGHNETLGASSGLSVAAPSLGSANWEHETALFILVLLAAILAYWLAYILQKSRWGLIWQGIRDRELVTLHLGINTRQYKALSFGICAAFGGLSGALWALYIGYLSPASFGFTLSVSLLAGIVLGGIRYLPGVVLGVGLLTLLEQNLLPLGLSSIGWMFEGLMMIVVILAFPKGIWHWIQKLC